MDNYNPHKTSYVLKSCNKLHINLLFGPPNTPEAKSIEIYFKFMKDEIRYSGATTKYKIKKI